MNGIKILYRATFSRIGRLLRVEGASDNFVTISVTNIDTGKTVSVKRFDDYTEAMDYYTEQLIKLKSVEELETMAYALKMLGLM